MDNTISTMKAAYITAYGPAEAIQVGDLPIPVLSPTDVLVHVDAVTVNHVDTFIRSGAYRTNTPFPFIIGRDLVGTVEDVGAGVTDFQPGDRVWSNSLGHNGRQGSFAEKASVAVERLYRLPDGVAAPEAVTVFHPAATAYLGLFREGRLRAGETVVVTGAAGGVGSAVVQMAVAAGARVVATASSHDAEYCLSLGAHAVVDYRARNVAAAIGKVTPEGVDLFWDNSGINDIEGMLPVLAQGARVVVMSGLNSRPEIPMGKLYTRDVSLHGFVISNASVSDLSDAATLINRLLAAGCLRTRISATLSLAEAAEAHRLQSAQGADRLKGRIVVRP